MQAGKRQQTSKLPRPALVAALLLFHKKMASQTRRRQRTQSPTASREVSPRR